MTIPVICDRCRVAGTAGTGDFSHYGDLLEFDPVPRGPRPRVDGWTEEKQRAFIALLATTGSQRRAAMALGMAPYGAGKLRHAPGADSFNAAWDRAEAIAKKNGNVKISTAVADAAARAAQLDAKPSRLRGHEPDDDDQAGMDEGQQVGLIEGLLFRWLGKVEQEREARISGEVVAADFYLRQVTFFEVAFSSSNSRAPASCRCRLRLAPGADACSNVLHPWWRRLAFVTHPQNSNECLLRNRNGPKLPHLALPMTTSPSPPD